MFCFYNCTMSSKANYRVVADACYLRVIAGAADLRGIAGAADLRGIAGASDLRGIAGAAYLRGIAGIMNGAFFSAERCFFNHKINTSIYEI